MPDESDVREYLEIRVLGLPSPQGSKSFKGLAKSGHAILAESSKTLKPWRDSVIWATREAMQRPPATTCIKGPVYALVTFTVPKPASAPKKVKTYPATRPDLDKLQRAVFDAVKLAGLIEDDSRVVWVSAAKCYPEEGYDALDVPGVVIKVGPITDKVWLARRLQLDFPFAQPTQPLNPPPPRENVDGPRPTTFAVPEEVGLEDFPE